MKALKMLQSNNTHRLIPIVLLTFALFTTSKLQAEVEMPRIFGSNMVLQRDMPLPIWGWAKPGEQITINFSRTDGVKAGEQRSTVADENGTWKVELGEYPTGGTWSLQIKGENTIDFNNILIGDVWICSGQSNMQWSIARSMNPQEETKNANYPEIRLFDVGPRVASPSQPKHLAGGSWQVCSPQTVRNFSAVGYHFGRELYKETGVPIGLICNAWGGRRIEPFTPLVGFDKIPELKEIKDRLDKTSPMTEKGQQVWMAYFDAMDKWNAESRAALKSGQSMPDMPQPPVKSDSQQPTQIYNTMVAPLVPFAVRGVIWYQGESNGNEGESYYHKKRALIEGWREVWGQDEPMYFYFVQLANFRDRNNAPEGGDGWANLREAQVQSLTIPRTGMAVTTDIGNAKDIHPRNKQDVGKRLARWALRDVYGQDLVVSGPLYKSMQVKDGKAYISFDHVGSGLMVGDKQRLEPTQEIKDGKLEGFSIQGSDGKWHWASAVIDGDQVVVSSPDVQDPKAVRYAFRINPSKANLYNKEGLPASPFKTD